MLLRPPNSHLMAPLFPYPRSSDLLGGARKRKPLNSGPLARQAELLAAIGGCKGLSAVVERLHRMAPQSPATAIAESRLALLRGDPRAAQEKLLAARQLAGDRPAIQLLAGRVAMALGNHHLPIAEPSRYLGGGVGG